MEQEQPSVKDNGISKKEKYVFHTLERNKNNNQLIKSITLLDWFGFYNLVDSFLGV